MTVYYWLGWSTNRENDDVGDDDNSDDCEDVNYWLTAWLIDWLIDCSFCLMLLHDFVLIST